MKWIGIHGASESGKDTVADFIVASFGGEKVALADPLKHFCRIVFGFGQQQLWGPGHLRNEPDLRFAGDERPGACTLARTRFREHAPAWLVQVLPHFGGTKRAEALVALTQWLEACLRQTGLTARHALQTLGTEWGRGQDLLMWVHYAERDAERRGVQGYCVIPDCRFLNEAQFLHTRNAPLLEVVRPGYDGDFAMAAGVAAHPSEMERVLQADAFRKCITHTIHNDASLETLKERVWGVLSPEAPWQPTVPTSTPPEIEPTPLMDTVLDTDTSLTSPLTSSTEEATTPPSAPSTSESWSGSSDNPTDPLKRIFNATRKKTSKKTGGPGQ